MSIAPATRALARLAWRELRRRTARSVLVVALVALPVGALTVGAVVVASGTANHDARLGAMGTADAAILLTQDAEARRADLAASYERQLPPGSRVLRVRERSDSVPGVRGRDVSVELSDLPLKDPLTAGMTKLLRGRPPAGPSEVAVASDVLRDLGLRVGDTFASRRLGLRAVVVAELLDATDVARGRVFTGGPLALTPALRTQTRLLVDLPPGTDPSAVQRLRGPGREVCTEISVPTDCPQLVLGVDDRRTARRAILTISAIALLIAGLVVAAAFAIGARRRLRAIGLLRAGAGADERHVRRLAALQGALCGGAGVIAGFALGLAGVAVLDAAGDAVTNPVTGRTSVPLTELALIAAMAIAATAAGAWLAGRSAARVPVLAALGGRAPLRAPVRALPIGGLVTSAVGTALLALGIDGGGPAGVGQVGAVLIVLGFVLWVPALVAVLGPLAARTRGTTRLAAREIARQRARTGPLVAAILAVASLALLGATLVEAERARSGDLGDLGIGPDQVLLSSAAADPSRRPPGAVSEHVRARVRALVPRAVEAPIGLDARATFLVPRESAIPSLGRRDESQIAIGGPRLLDALGAPAGRAALARGEVVVLREGLIDGGRVTIVTPGAGGQPRELRARASEAIPARPQRQLVVSLVVSPQAATRLGLSPTLTAAVLRAPAPLTAAQRQALRAQALAFDRDTTGRADAQILVSGTAHEPRVAVPLTLLLALAAALTLAVVGSGLALTGAEGRADDSMLVALGADPGARRRLRATQAAMLVAIAGLLAIPAGLIPAAVIVRGPSDFEPRDGPLELAVPWTALGVVLLVLPALAAAGAWLLARPARWSPPATAGD